MWAHNYQVKGAYSVFYRTDRDDVDERNEFKTSTKTWDADDFDMRMLVEEIADDEFHSRDGWEWWKQGDVVVFFLYAPEVDGGEPGGASIGNFSVSFDIRPEFSARKLP